MGRTTGTGTVPMLAFRSAYPAVIAAALMTAGASGVALAQGTVGFPNWEVYGHWQDRWRDDPSQIRTDVFYLLG